MIKERFCGVKTMSKQCQKEKRMTHFEISQGKQCYFINN